MPSGPFSQIRSQLCFHNFYLFPVNVHSNESQGPVESGIARSNTLCDHEQNIT